MNLKFYKFVKLIVRPIVKVLYKIEIIGKEKSSNLKGGYILCSNHLSNWDPVFLILINDSPIRFMAKEELFKNKVLNWFFSSMGAFAVKRGKGDNSAIEFSKSIIKNKENLGIFIEGTRSKNGNFLRPKSGVSIIASSTRSNILPICITGVGKDNKIKLFHKVRIVYGEPIIFENIGMNTESRTEIKKFTEFIMNRIVELRN